MKFHRLLLSFVAVASTAAAAGSSVGYRIQLDTVSEGWDGKYCWTQARAGAIPRTGQPPIVVITASPLLVTGSDVYFDIHDWRTDDLGETWTGPVKHSESLGRKVIGHSNQGTPITRVPGDWWPQYHAASGKLLGFGVTFHYVDDLKPMHALHPSHRLSDFAGDLKPIAERKLDTCYSTYDPATRQWSALKTLTFTDPELAWDARAACVQRYDLPDGDILLPIYFKRQEEEHHRVKVLRCGFDGSTLTVKEQGGTLRLDIKRGLAEPSLTRFRDKFFLTIRHEEAGYVTTGADGLHFGALKPWTWDDGTPLGTYNTQTHWVTHRDALFLVYTRRGAGNDHVFRHRAPLFIAEVDAEKFVVKRATERVLIPEKGARYGNFGVCDVNEHETWIVETEWMQRQPPEFVIPVENKWGAKARIYAARILWEKPNR